MPASPSSPPALAASEHAVAARKAPFGDVVATAAYARVPDLSGIDHDARKAAAVRPDSMGPLSTACDCSRHPGAEAAMEPGPSSNLATPPPSAAPASSTRAAQRGALAATAPAVSRLDPTTAGRVSDSSPDSGRSGGDRGSDGGDCPAPSSARQEASRDHLPPPPCARDGSIHDRRSHQDVDVSGEAPQTSEPAAAPGSGGESLPSEDQLSPLLAGIARLQGRRTSLAQGAHSSWVGGASRTQLVAASLAWPPPQPDGLAPAPGQQPLLMSTRQRLQQRQLRPQPAEDAAAAETVAVPPHRAAASRSAFFGGAARLRSVDASWPELVLERDGLAATAAAEQPAAAQARAPPRVAAAARQQRLHRRVRPRAEAVAGDDGTCSDASSIISDFDRAACVGGRGNPLRRSGSDTSLSDAWEHEVGGAALVVPRACRGRGWWQSRGQRGLLLSAVRCGGGAFVSLPGVQQGRGVWGGGVVHSVGRCGAAQSVGRWVPP